MQKKDAGMVDRREIVRGRGDALASDNLSRAVAPLLRSFYSNRAGDER
jgi:hypothetical protein